MPCQLRDVAHDWARCRGHAPEVHALPRAVESDARAACRRRRLLSGHCGDMITHQPTRDGEACLKLATSRASAQFQWRSASSCRRASCYHGLDRPTSIVAHPDRRVSREHVRDHRACDFWVDDSELYVCAGHQLMARVDAASDVASWLRAALASQFGDWGFAGTY